MDKALFTEPAAIVLAKAREAGFDVSEMQLARWHRIGLLRRPWQRRLGRGKGTESVYPTGTGDQLVALCTIHRNKRRLEVIGWELFRAGWQIDARWWKPQLIKAAELWDEAIPDIRTLLNSTDENVAAKATELFHELATRRLPKSPFTAIRKRVRARKQNRKLRKLGLEPSTLEHYTAHAEEDFSLFLKDILKVAVGEFDGWQTPKSQPTQLDQEKRTMDRGLLIDRAKENQWPQVGPIVPPNFDIGMVLVSISRCLRTPLTRVIKNASNEELISARNEIGIVMTIFDVAGGFLEEAFGANAFGMKNAVRLYREMKETVSALMILLWHIIRNGMVAELNTAEILKLAPEVQKIANVSALIENLREQNASAKEMLSPRRIRGALRNPRKKKQLLREIRTIQETPAEDQSPQSRIPSK